MAIKRIDEFLNKLFSNEVNIELLCLGELAYLRKEYNVSSEANEKGVFSGLATYKRAITDYRKAIYLADSKNLALKHFNLSDEDKANFSKQNENTSFRNFKNVELWEKHVIKDTDGYIETSIKLLEANSYIDNILGIAALTGRRVGEIGYFSEFETIEQSEFDNEYRNFNLSCDGIKVIGLSKKKTYSMPDRTVSAIIPVLYDAQAICNAFKELRSKKSFESHEKFHNTANKELSKKVRKHYSEYLGDCTSHDLRKAYARITFDYFADLPDEALSILISKILCQTIPANYLKFSAS